MSVCIPYITTQEVSYVLTVCRNPDHLSNECFNYYNNTMIRYNLTRWEAENGSHVMLWRGLLDNLRHTIPACIVLFQTDDYKIRPATQYMTVLGQIECNVPKAQRVIKAVNVTAAYWLHQSVLQHAYEDKAAQFITIKVGWKMVYLCQVR